MDTIWFVVLAIVLAGGSIAIGIIRNRRFQQKEALHSKLAANLGLDLAYASDQDYSLFGKYREYSLRIEPINLAAPGAKTPAWYTKGSIPMVNPVRKMIRIARRNDSFPELEKLVQVGAISSMQHDLEPWLDIQSNDLMFASIILTENTKISTHKAFRNLNAGLVYIEDEELSFVMPGLLTDERHLESVVLGMELLCDIKDELNAG